MLDYVAKLTREPKQVRREDVERLRQVGFADADILAICEVTGYYAYVNRIADGLGVELGGVALNCQGRSRPIHDSHRGTETRRTHRGTAKDTSF